MTHVGPHIRGTHGRPPAWLLSVKISTYRGVRRKEEPLKRAARNNILHTHGCSPMEGMKGSRWVDSESLIW